MSKTYVHVITTNTSEGQFLVPVTISPLEILSRFVNWISLSGCDFIFTTAWNDWIRFQPFISTLVHNWKSIVYWFLTTPSLSLSLALSPFLPISPFVLLTLPIFPYIHTFLSSPQNISNSKFWLFWYIYSHQR